MKDNPLNTQVGGKHYKDLAIQPAEFVMANKIPWAEGNAITYIVRHRNKNGREDLEKAKHFIDMIIAREYPTEKEPKVDDLDYPLGKWFKNRSGGEPFKVCSRKGTRYHCEYVNSDVGFTTDLNAIITCLQISAP